MIFKSNRLPFNVWKTTLVFKYLLMWSITDLNPILPCDIIDIVIALNWTRILRERYSKFKDFDPKPGAPTSAAPDVGARRIGYMISATNGALPRRYDVTSYFFARATDRTQILELYKFFLIFYNSFLNASYHGLDLKKICTVIFILLHFIRKIILFEVKFMFFFIQCYFFQVVLWFLLEIYYYRHYFYHNFQRKTNNIRTCGPAQLPSVLLKGRSFISIIKKLNEIWPCIINIHVVKSRKPEFFPSPPIRNFLGLSWVRLVRLI